MFMGFGNASRASWEVLGWSQGSWNVRKITRLHRLDSFEFMGNSDLESSGLIMRNLGWLGENDPWPIT